MIYYSYPDSPPQAILAIYPNHLDWLPAVIYPGTVGLFLLTHPWHDSLRLEDMGWTIEDSMVWHRPDQENAVIWLVRWPRGKLRYVDCAEQFGTSGLNIQGTLLPVHGERPYREIDPKDTQNSVYSGRVLNQNGYKGGSKALGGTTAGRWPTNAVLEHHAECQQTGYRQIRNASGSIDGNEPSTPHVYVYGKTNRVPFQKKGDEQGFEWIENWDCHAGCPAKRVNELSDDEAGSRYLFTFQRQEVDSAADIPWQLALYLNQLVQPPRPASLLLYGSRTGIEIAAAAVCGWHWIYAPGSPDGIQQRVMAAIEKVAKPENNPIMPVSDKGYHTDNLF